MAFGREALGFMQMFSHPNIRREGKIVCWINTKKDKNDNHGYKISFFPQVKLGSLAWNLLLVSFSEHRCPRALPHCPGSGHRSHTYSRKQPSRSLFQPKELQQRKRDYAMSGGELQNRALELYAFPRIIDRVAVTAGIILLRLQRLADRGRLGRRGYKAFSQNHEKKMKR